MRRLWTGSCLAFVAFAGCATPIATGEGTSSSAAEGILGGTPVGTLDPNSGYVAQLDLHVPVAGDPRGTEIYCSGVMIADDAILTAAHCVEGYDQPGAYFSYSVGQFLSGGYQQIRVHPDYKHFADDTGFYDAAIIQLGFPAGKHGRLPLFRGTLGVGTELYGYGYGLADLTGGGRILRWAKLTVASTTSGYPGTYELGRSGAGQAIEKGDSGGPSMYFDPSFGGCLTGTHSYSTTQNQSGFDQSVTSGATQSIDDWITQTLGSRSPDCANPCATANGGCPANTTCAVSSNVIGCLCNPATQCHAGSACGTEEDGCGGTIDCGQCKDGDICSPTNHCLAKSSKEGCLVGCGQQFDSCTTGSDPLLVKSCTTVLHACQTACNCVRNTCASIRATCGNPSDGCGGSLSCGTCSDNQECSAASTCVCVPQTSCGGQCGTISDGCGGTLHCPSCACVPSCGGRRCGGGDGCGGTCYGSCGKAGYVCSDDGTGAKFCMRGW